MRYQEDPAQTPESNRVLPKEYFVIGLAGGIVGLALAIMSWQLF